jgi:hypothetical protein
MKQILTFIVAVLYTAVLMAGNITPEAAKQIAKQQLRVHSGTTRSLQAEPKLVYTSYGTVKGDQTEALTRDAAFYVFNGEGAGYVVIAGDDRQTPLLGYSDNGTFPEGDNIPSNMKWWFEQYTKEYNILQSTPESCFYEEFQTRSDEYKSSVSPLLGDIKWDQDDPYNRSCPSDGGIICPTGCVATAMAQVMKYYNYPEKGTGSVNYSTYSNKINVQCDFSQQTFDWNNMLPKYTTGNFTTTQANAVAKLMFACGASIHMNYTQDESGAVTQYVAYALRENFSYAKSATFVQRSWFTNSQWLSLVKNELSNGRPVVYGGDSSNEGGHEFVFDGYDTNDYMHVNWGWSGYYDGYFKITSLKPESVGTGGGTGAESGFNIDQDMVVGIAKSSSTTEAATVFYLEELVSSASSVSVGSKFNVTANALYNFGTKFEGQIALLLVSSSGSATQLGQAKQTSVPFYNYFSTLDFSGVSIPSGTKSGTYSLCIGTKKSGATSWTIVNSARNGAGRLQAYVSNGTVKISNYYGDFSAKVTDYSFDKKFYLGAENKITMTLDNSTRGDIYTQLGLGLISEDGKKSYSLSLGALEVLEDETTKTVSYNFQIPSDSLTTGKYTIVPLAEWGGTLIMIGEAKTIEIETATSDYSLLKFITYPTIDKEVYAPGEAINISCQVGLSDETQNYVDTWYWFIFPYPGGTSLTYVTNPVTIEKGDVLNMKFSFTPDLADGKYFTIPYVVVNNATKKLLDSNYCPIFTISSQTTGIDDISADDNRLVIYPQPIEETLNMRSPADARSVDIYDMSGRRVVSQSLGGGRTHSVGVGSLTAGTYIVNVNCDGKIYKEKFVKR